ncbi:MAG TPA: helix-turn-helix transcriptional regulator, partial [Nitrospiria bacterium]|nr:helix-turn-helix transcriptional regulator [Nitrospiria bacterium]
MSLGAHIQTWRNRRSLSVEELARKSGLSPETLQKLESGKVDPPASSLASIAEALGVPLPWLYTDPHQLDALSEEESPGKPEEDPVLRESADPVLDHILRAKSVERNLFHLLALLIHSGEEKQIR